MLRSDEPVALDLHLAIDFDDALGIDTDQSPADMGCFIIPSKCEVFRAEVTVTETCGGDTSTPVVKFDLRPTAGSDTERGDGDIAELKLLTTVAGKVMFDEVAKGTVLEPGMEVMVELTTQAVGTGAAGHVLPSLLVKYLPESKANLSDLVETT